MLHISTLLKYYKQHDIQQAMVNSADNKEIAVKYGEKGFGKRPDILQYPNDVLEFVKKGATSFHVSEEHWRNPLQLGPQLKRQEITDLRIGWDLILDIDCKIWEISKLTTYFLVEALKHHNLKTISVKFSGNKGFHIGVPFKSFPEEVHGEETRSIFPDGPRKIAAYLQEMIREPLTKRILEEFNINELADKIEKPFADLVKDNVFDPFEIVDIDTILISTRHLYRMPYSLHEKSGLASIPIDPNKVLEFDKKQAEPANVIVSDTIYLPTPESNEARKLILQALDFTLPEKEEKPLYPKREYKNDILIINMSEDLFPPCIHNIFKGMVDGKKRAMFILVNFLKTVGWDNEKIEKRVKEWNEKNPEPLREVILLGHLRHHLNKKEIVLPPNCDNKPYYEDLRICTPDNLCKKIKNPAQYAKRRAFFVNLEDNKNKRKKKGTQETQSVSEQQKTESPYPEKKTNDKSEEVQKEEPLKSNDKIQES